MIYGNVSESFEFNGMKIDQIKHRSLEIWHFEYERFGLKGLIAFTGKKSSIGGIRWIDGTPYITALHTVCELAVAMAEKAFVAGLHMLDGVKMFVYEGKKTPECSQRVGEFIEFWGGRYRASVDMGTTPKDMNVIRKNTQYVTTINPSPFTARGVRSVIHATARMYDIPLPSLRVFISGLGQVGYCLAEQLVKDKVKVFGNDITTDLDRIRAIKSLGVQFISEESLPIPEDKIHIFSPCAGGGIINYKNNLILRHAGVRLVAGSANCQLKKGNSSAEHLHLLGIDWAPDVITNSGGLIAAAQDFGFIESIESRINQIGETVVDLIEISHSKGSPIPMVMREYFSNMKKVA